MIDPETEVWFRDNADTVRYDFCTWNEVESRYEFYYDDVLTAWAKEGNYRFYGRSAPEATGPEYRLITVRFNESGRSYDYICEEENVQPGDTVIVNGYDGKTEVTVVKVTTRRESELPLPADRYKRILRKE